MNKLVYAILCFSCLLFSGAASSFAQDQGVEFTDVVSGGGPAADIGRAVARDATGNTYVAGTFADFADFPPDQLLAMGGGREVFVLKYDMFGTLLWSLQAADPLGNPNVGVSDIAIDELGNVYLAGNFTSSSVDFGGLLVSNASLSGGNDAYVAKLNPDGAFIWAVPINGPGNDRVYDIEIDKRNQAVYIAGSFQDSCLFSVSPEIKTFSAGGTDAFVARLDYDGNFIWSEQSGGPLDDEARAVSADLNGTVYTAGNFSSQTQLFAFLTANNLGGAGQFDTYVAAYQPDAVPLWARSFGGNGADRVAAMVIDTATSNLFLTGAFTNQSNWGATQLNAANPFDTAMFVAKLDDAGNVLWASQNDAGPSVVAQTIALDTSASPVTAGRFSRTASFGCGSITEAYTQLGNSSSDLFVAKFDGADGSVRTAARAGGPDRPDAGLDLFIDDQDGIFLTGFYSDTTYFSDNKVDPFGAAGTDYFAARIEITNSACGVPSDGGRTYSNASPACLFSLDTVLVSGYTGVFQGWEYSLDGGATWTSLSDPRDFRRINVVPGDRPIYRGIVESCNCPAAPSDSLELPIDAPSRGGSIASDDTVCILGNNGQLNLENSLGDVVQWEQTQDEFETISVLAVTDAFYDYSNVLTRTRYRALVQNGTCPPVYSDTVTLDVAGCEVCGIDPTVGGVTTGEDTVCSAANGGIVKLQNYTGDIVRWELSTDGFRTVTTRNIAVEEFPYANVTETTAFRAVVQSPTCDPVYSSVTVITVGSCEACGTPPSEIGGISGEAVVCAADNEGLITLSGVVGDVARWEYAVNYDPDNPKEGLFIPINNPAPVQDYRNLAQSRWYRAVVQSGLCDEVVSDVVKIQVKPCADCRAPQNLAVTRVTGETASITWDGRNNDIEYEVQIREPGTPIWAPQGSRPERSTYTITGLDLDTEYEVRVRALCPEGESPFSDVVTFKTSCTFGGQAQATNPLVCAGNNSFTISVENQLGNVLRWEVSFDGFLTIDEVLRNPAESFPVNDISANTSYRALVKLGDCGEVYSEPVTVEVQPCNTCPAPEVLRATDITANTARFYFVPLGQEGAEYDLDLKPVNAAEWNNGWSDQGNAVSSPIFASALPPSTTFQARLRNRCPDGTYSQYSEVITFRTAGGAFNCSTPIITTIDPQITTAYVEWTSVPGVEFYEVRYRVEGRLTWFTVQTADRFLFLENLPPSGRHPIAVRAYCGYDYSGYSNFDFIETGGKPCLAPGAPQAARSSLQSVELEWEPGLHADTYVLRYREQGETAWTETTADSSGLLLENLLPGTFYEGQVKSVCGPDNESLWSPSGVFNTLLSRQAANDAALQNCRVYPNPSRGAFTVTWQGVDEAPTEIALRGVDGRLVYRKTLRASAGENAHDVRLDHYAPGVYLLEIRRDDEARHLKIILE